MTNVASNICVTIIKTGNQTSGSEICRMLIDKIGDVANICFRAFYVGRQKKWSNI